MLLKDLLDVLKEYEDQSCLLNVRLELTDPCRGDMVGIDRSHIDIKRTKIDEIMISQVTDDFKYFD